MKKLTKFISPKVASLLTMGILLPQIAGAATCVAPAPGLATIICKINDLLNLIIPVLIVLGVVYFIWGVIGYVTAKDEEKKTEARGVMISGIIGLFVIVSIWGLVSLLTQTFGIGNGSSGYTAPVF